ncbi:helix-turn-helix domain-containing protein [Corynebacterium pseudodiphtheriticum]|uniref:helix-turn-helix domain-containing protein n=1 Tax=Corynebacterium pseudodiphtheriticum TaxID=37637 RepID=UPI002550D871|nr:helix-turn-helix transcriptional regulator [Corynebacterium pseudodiphtheriticum]MDK8563248.1 helix-turn-helix transcriptional regulator [Corynebacterium pseudodiphtheriticum]
MPDFTLRHLRRLIPTLTTPATTVKPMTTPATPGRGRTSRPAPNALYPAWPSDPTCHGADALVQTFVANLATVVETNLTAGVSQAELCRRAGVGKATLTKILQGAVWPDSRTVARFETAVQQRLWVGPA